MNSRLRLVGVALCLSSALAVGGCSGDDDPTSNTPGGSGGSGGKADDPNGQIPELPEPPDEVLELFDDYFEFDSKFGEDGVGVVRAPGGGIVLRAKSCQQAKSYVSALDSLRRRVSPFLLDPANVPDPRELEDGWCEVKIDAVLTPYLAQTFWKVIDDTSVDINCWAHALKTAEVDPAIGLADANLFSHILNSDQCTMLSPNDSPIPGDIISIRMVEEKNGAVEFGEWHGAVWLTEDLWITKNGAARFDISPSRRVLKEYVNDTANLASKPQCANRSDRTIDRETALDCGIVVQAFRCKTRDDFINQKAQDISNYDMMWMSVGGMLSHRILMQQELEGLPDGSVDGEPDDELDASIARGDAYVSRYPFDLASHYYYAEGEEVPEEVAEYIEAASKHPYMDRDYSLQHPELPALPSEFLAKLEAQALRIQTPVSERDPLGEGEKEVGFNPHYTAHICEGDGYGLFQDYYSAKQAEAFARFEEKQSSMSATDKYLCLAVMHEMCGADVSSYETCMTLGSKYAPSRVLIPAD